MDLREAFLLLENDDSVTKIKFKNGLRAELPSGLILHIQRYKHKYRASIMKGTDVYWSPEYLKKENLNNWLKKYKVELLFDKEK